MFLKRFVAALLCLTLLVGLMVSAMAAGTAKQSWFRYEQVEADLQAVQERKDAAHDMAEAARALGMEEDCDIIQTAKEIWHKADEEVAALQEELDRLDNKGYAYNFQLFQPTNLSAEAFDYLLAGSKLAGHGSDFCELEQTYQVNGLFAMAVAKVESGLGSSKLAVKKNNYYGMLGNSFETPHDGILAFGRLMNHPTYHNKTLTAISRTYCPPTAGKWANAVTSIMLAYWNKLS